LSRRWREATDTETERKDAIKDADTDDESLKIIVNRKAWATKLKPGVCHIKLLKLSRRLLSITY
jgi:hypothetical protein